SRLPGRPRRDARSSSSAFTARSLPAFFSSAVLPVSGSGAAFGAGAVVCCCAAEAAVDELSRARDSASGQCVDCCIVAAVLGGGAGTLSVCTLLAACGSLAFAASGRLAPGACNGASGPSGFAAKICGDNCAGLCCVTLCGGALCRLCAGGGADIPADGSGMAPPTMRTGPFCCSTAADDCEPH